MTASLLPVEQDLLDPDDALSHYRRIFNGPPESGVDHYSPDDKGRRDPEAPGALRVW